MPSDLEQLWVRESLNNQEALGHGGTAPREGHSVAWFLSPPTVFLT